MKIPPKLDVAEPDLSGPVLQNEGDIAFSEGWNACVDWVLRGGELPHVVSVDGTCSVCKLGSEGFPLTTGCCGIVCDTSNPGMVNFYRRSDFMLGHWEHRK